MEILFPMESTMLRLACTIACSTVVASAQNLIPNGHNLVPNGEFEQGPGGWTHHWIPGTDGGTGFAPARVAGTGPSVAVFSTMRTPATTLMTVYGSRYYSAPFTLPSGTFPVGVRVMWQNPTGLPLPPWNDVEFVVRDAAGAAVYSATLVSPDPQGSESRSSRSGAFPANGGVYWVDLTITNGQPVFGTAGNTILVDDIYIGSRVFDGFGQGCAGSGGLEPLIGTRGWPQLGAAGFSFELYDAFAPSLAMLALDTTAPRPGVPLGGGCTLLVGTSTLCTVPVTGNGNGQGRASFVQPIPQDVTLWGVSVFAQWGVLDPGGASPLNLSVTSAVVFTVQ